VDELPAAIDAGAATIVTVAGLTVLRCDELHPTKRTARKRQTGKIMSRRETVDKCVGGNLYSVLSLVEEHRSMTIPEDGRRTPQTVLGIVSPGS